MSKKPWEDIAPGPFRDAIAGAWDKFEEPGNQKKLSADQLSKKRKERERSSALRIKELRRMGLPTKIATMVANNLVHSTPAVLALEQRKAMRLIVLAGNTGTGKTVAACSLFTGKHTGFIMRATELVELGKSYGDRETLKKARSCGILLLDDLGVEYQDERMSSRLDDILDARINHRLMTVVTTNMTAQEFQRRYAERVWSRIHEHGDYVELDAPDMRITPLPGSKKD